jgi:superoxide dismutase, Fe-Mn family
MAERAQEIRKEQTAPKIHDFYKLPNLPYPQDALEPVLSKETIDIHYGKHAKGYFEKTNELVPDTELEGMPLEDLVKQVSGKLFNHAAQAWNHVFFFSCLAKPDSKKMSPAFEKVLNQQFGSVDKFKEKFSKKAVDIFGSGWAWLVKLPDGKLKIDCRPNAGTPIVDNIRPLLTCDVWEHAYYIDYRNERDTYLDAFWRVVNWDFVETNYNSTSSQLLV